MRVDGWKRGSRTKTSQSQVRGEVAQVGAALRDISTDMLPVCMCCPVAGLDQGGSVRRCNNDINGEVWNVEEGEICGMHKKNTHGVNKIKFCLEVIM